MANFDEDIRRITNEVLQDGTIESMIRDKIVNGFEAAIDSAFKWGDLHNAIEKRIKEILVPFIERYNMSDYLIKLDTVLVDIIKNTSLQENKRLLENFKELMITPENKKISIAAIYEKYKKYVAEEMETSGRKVSWDDGAPEYESITVGCSIEKEDNRSWSCFENAILELYVGEEEQEKELNRTIRLSRYKNDSKEGWEIRTEHNPTIASLRYMNEIDIFLLKLEKAGVKLDYDGNYDCYENDVYSTTKPEPTFE